MNTTNRTQATSYMALGGYANTGLSIIQGLLLIPVYIHFIGLNLYGFWLATGGILRFLGIVDIGISAMLVQRVSKAYGGGRNEEAGDYFINALLIYFVLIIMFVLFGYSLAIWGIAFLHNGIHLELLQTCFLISVIATSINLLNECMRAFSQALLRPVSAITILIIGRILGLICTVLLLIFDHGLISIPLGMIITSLIVFKLNIINVLRAFRILDVNPVIKKDIIIDYLKLSPALFVGRIGSSLVSGIEPLIITVTLSNPGIAATYVIVQRASVIVSNLLSVIIASTAPSFGNLIGEKKYDEMEHVARTIISLVFVFGLIGFGSYVALNESFVHIWMGPDFKLSSEIHILIAVSGLLVLVVNSFNRLLVSLGDIHTPSIWILFEAVSRLLLMFILAKIIGLWGIPLAIFGTNFCFLIALQARLKKCMCTSRSYLTIRHVILFTCSFAFAMLADEFIAVHNSWIAFILNSLLISIILSVAILGFESKLRNELLYRINLLKSKRGHGNKEKTF